MNNSQPTQHAKMTATVTLQPAQKPNGAETRIAPSPERKNSNDVKIPEAVKPDLAPAEAATHQEQGNTKDTEAAPTSESKTNGNKTDKSTAIANKQAKKRTRKTIDQELAELEQRRAKLLEAKRKNETREKIVFGAIAIKALKNALISTNYKLAAEKIMEKIIDISNGKEKEIIEKIIDEIRTTNK